MLYNVNATGHARFVTWVEKKLQIGEREISQLAI
jgi:hypothetical protein